MKTFRMLLAALPLEPMVALAGWGKTFSATDQTFQTLTPDGLIADGTSTQRRKPLPEWRSQDGRSLPEPIFHDEKHPSASRERGISRRPKSKEPAHASSRASTSRKPAVIKWGSLASTPAFFKKTPPAIMCSHSPSPLIAQIDGEISCQTFRPSGALLKNPLSPIAMHRFLLLFFTLSLVAAEPAAVNFEEHIKPIFREHCLKCHGEEEQKADLSLQTLASTIKGGSGGAGVVAGRSSQSLVFQAITNPDDDNRMPPKKPMIPQAQIALIQKWIDSGLRETSASKSLVAERDLSFKPLANAGTKPSEPAMPGALPPVKLPALKRPLPVLTLDASPWAPLAAVAGQDHVRLMNLETQKEAGLLAFPEGEPHLLRFSRDGAVLMAAGGKPVEIGKVVLFEVKTGKRLATLGDEVDAVLAADLSADQTSVALGGSGKAVKVYDTASGKLRYKITKHTDWIMAVAFSPDGKTLATADRAGGLHLWEAATGRALLSLNDHKASIRALDWRADSKLLASAAEDGLIIWWDVKDGWPAITKTDAHPPIRPPGMYGKIANGVLAARFDHEGRLCTAGRDHKIRVWDAAGKEIQSFSIPNAQPLSTALSFDGKKVIGGDTAGQVHFWEVSAKN